ncbi:hypothetical protein TorRG33x02_068070 [Trema orientale]|uniref:Uncharacterized protein n=1 Tax=Trema orientale TaxID=63057 RepID=A0A2P5FHS3_TREOI|nr:hypothetical protein TorRG33x02_068070 [Trema orientale]
MDGKGSNFSSFKTMLVKHNFWVMEHMYRAEFMSSVVTTSKVFVKMPHSVVTLSEIETERRHHSTPGSASDSVSLASKSTSDEPLEPSPFNPCDTDMITSATDSMISDQAHDILGFYAEPKVKFLFIIHIHGYVFVFH